MSMPLFNLSSLHDEALGSRPGRTERPLIGLTGNFGEGESRLAKAYYRQVELAGGTPIIIPPCSNSSIIHATLDRIDALILTGGADINPLWQGEMPSIALHGINAERDMAELLAVRLAYDRCLPVLGICRGMQAMATALGGKVIQDIYEWAQNGEHKHALIKHSQEAERHEPTHPVLIEEGSRLHKIYDGKDQVLVNSLHHQAVGDTGPCFKATATAPDGIIEAMESNCMRPVMAVQWHPENLADEGLRLFQWLTSQAILYRRARNFHNNTLTLDTHCDTPMFFNSGADFTGRDERIKVDYHKMVDGGLSTATMVAYVPQTTASPFDYANSLLDEVERQVGSSQGRMAIAITPAELYHNRRRGMRSVMLAVENAHALEHDIAHVEHFARRGVVYITLCHNGDNAICDSARGQRTHGGVSAYGADVIREMNRCGLMVDLSHASEESFYDAMQVSNTPIACSHSSCRALCDHPRNLDDDQLRALKSNGGLMHITLYPGFLRQGGEATVRDVVQHINHAVDIMGTEHVGIGTDFDGDGGVRGCNDASEMINLTMHLLRQRYGNADLKRIWGDNWLRLMRQVQQCR